ncbi:MAG: TetR/AcrR family transcriptional regulator [Solirubrobacterales bacterium]|nr:TetR/AcrR family transcriptional regulator [Solirubrobacterales bacterium]
MAAGRTTHLEPEEIAAETLRLFDAGGDPSIRQLATALNVTPSAIYHHFTSRAEIVQAAVDLVWAEVLTETSVEVGDPFEADPVETLVTLGIFARRSFLKHYKITPYMAAIPRSDELSATGIALFANVFERLGLSGPAAGSAFHYYASYCFGNALYAASRLNANEQLGPEHPGHEELEKFRASAGIQDTSSKDTRAALDAILDLSELDPERDEELFVLGMKQILEGFTKV